MAQKVVAGVDPGSNTGIALYRKSQLRILRTITPAEFAESLTWLAPDMVVFEDSRLQRHVWTAAGQSRAAAIKIGRNVGQVDQMCADIEATCKARGIMCVGISPLKKGAKLDAKTFKALTGWTGRTSQHARDAAMVAWPYRMAGAVGRVDLRDWKI